MITAITADFTKCDAALRYQHQAVWSRAAEMLATLRAWRVNQSGATVHW